MMSFVIVLQCAGKVNNITIDKCTKMGVVFTVSRKYVKQKFIFMDPKYWDGCVLNS